MREEIENRPLVIILVGLILGLIAVLTPLCLVLIPVFILLLRSLRTRSLLASSFLVGLLLAPSLPSNLSEAQPIRGVGTLVSAPKIFADRETFRIAFHDRNLEVTAPTHSNLCLGDSVLVSGIERPVTSAQADYAHLMGIEGTLSLDEIRVVQHAPWIMQVGDSMRRHAVKMFGESLPDAQAALMDGICFNSGSLLDKVDRQELRDSGLLHVLTVAGLQVAMLALYLQILLRFVPVPRHVQIVILTFLLCLYALASGLNPAIVRASFAMIIGTSAYLFRREPDALSALALSAIAYLLWDRNAVFSMGFQMTYITAGLVALFYRRSPNDRTNGKRELIRLTNEYLRLYGVILMATTPLILYFFGSLNLLSMESNLLVALLLPATVTVGFVAWGTSLVVFEAGASISHVLARPMTDAILTLSQLSAVGIRVEVGSFSGYWLVAFYMAWLATYRRRLVRP